MRKSVTARRSPRAFVGSLFENRSSINRADSRLLDTVGLNLRSPQWRMDATLDHMLGRFVRMLRASRRQTAKGGH
jgi:hypothetical protein